mmetsp:Transcript_47842/g.152619  ORF Transcript_47842/g.152619 Transcript_47842/m.152619 type:complete len:294 (-) Transcript_47842:2932-3813(-)
MCVFRVLWFSACKLRNSSSSWPKWPGLSMTRREKMRRLVLESSGLSIMREICNASASRSTCSHAAAVPWGTEDSQPPLQRLWQDSPSSARAGLPRACPTASASLRSSVARCTARKSCRKSTVVPEHRGTAAVQSSLMASCARHGPCARRGLRDRARAGEASAGGAAECRLPLAPPPPKAGGAAARRSRSSARWATDATSCAACRTSTPWPLQTPHRNAATPKSREASSSSSTDSPDSKEAWLLAPSLCKTSRTTRRCSDARTSWVMSSSVAHRWRTPGSFEAAPDDAASPGSR